MYRMELAKIEVNDFGGAPVATHNYPCPVFPEEHAVLHMNDGVFHPSWKARREGWRLVCLDSWWKKLVYRHLFGETP